MNRTRIPLAVLILVVGVGVYAISEKADERRAAPIAEAVEETLTEYTEASDNALVGQLDSITALILSGAPATQNEWAGILQGIYQQHVRTSAQLDLLLYRQLIIICDESISPRYAACRSARLTMRDSLSPFVEAKGGMYEF